MIDSFKRGALKASVIYWLLTLTWVLIINALMGAIVQTRHDMKLFTTCRGIAFATITAVLLYLFMVKQARRFRKESEERDRAEEALRKSELHLRAAQALAHVGSWEWDCSAKKAILSDELFRIFQIRPEDFTGDARLVEQRIHPDDLKRFREAMSFPIQNHLPLPHPVEFRIVLPSGENRTLISLNPPQKEAYSNPNRIVGVIQDITEMRRQESALRESESRLKEAERLAQLGSGSWDMRAERAVWSDEMYRIFGRDPALLAPKFTEVAEFYTGDSWKKYSEALKAVVESGDPYDLRLRIVRPDKSVRDVRARGAAERDRNGDIIRVVGTVQDITDWKKAEETLRLQAIALQSAANAIAITDSSGAITYVNEAFTKLTGYSPEEVMGGTMQILNSGRQDALFYRHLWDTISSGIVWRGHLVNKRKDGAVYDAEETITPVKSNGMDISHFIAIKRDITEQIRSELTLKSSMSALRELAARLEKVREDERKSISHEVHDELGQVLTAVKMNLLSLEQDKGLDEKEFVEKLRATVLLIDESMKTVRDVAARLRPGVLDYLGLIPAIEWQVERFQKMSGIKCHMNMPQKEPDIDEEQSTVLFRILQEALTNVARHAHAGKVDICLSEYAGEYMMSVTDNGVGIRQDQVDNPRSFGLLGIRERLRPLGGRCAIHSHEGGGTEVIVNLPMKLR